MLSSFRFWAALAGVSSLLICLVHVFLGGPEIHELGLASSLPDGWKAVFSVVWHGTTALLALNSLFLILLSLCWRRNQLLLAHVFLLNVSYVILFVAYGWLWLGDLLMLPQWIAFGIVCGLIAVAMLVSESAAIIEERPVDARFSKLLASADFSDNFALNLPVKADAHQIADRVFGQPPVWVHKLLALRNLVVAPFGLKVEPKQLDPNLRRIGMFPIVHQDQDHVVMGFNDKHLDFRVIVGVERDAQLVTLSTLVQTHNVWGKAYMFVVKPFHKLIVPSMLARVSASS